MGSEVISFRVTDDTYEDFEKKCKDEGVSPTTRLRDYVDSVCHTKVKEPDVAGEAQVKVIQVEGERVDRISDVDSKKKSWFPLDFSPLFGKD